MSITQKTLDINHLSLQTIKPVLESSALSSSQIKGYQDDGFVIIRKFFTPEEIAPLQEIIKSNPDFNNFWTKRNTDKSGDNFKVAVWTELGNSIFGVIPRMARMINAAEALLEQKCYHWHSKIVKVQPNNTGLAWHQDYDYWYQDGCLFPQLLTCTIALSPANKNNGCLQVVKGSHLVGRVNHVSVKERGNQNIPESPRLEKILERHEVVYCELEPGDVVFFHANTLHGSGANSSENSRILMHSSYNAANNAPFIKEGQEHHQYRPLIKLSDSTIRENQYTPGFDINDFHPTETNNSLGKGVFYRKSWDSE
ncbi:Phytanoyl-CoA dioxygenase [[Leptolyngbya] sp. PCC 7376]|uniref:phytanoyl-CoA dioxygenase family protein n=1 Tax=[Leptolyngbya] sp. PCC 7376 TaxID=111781 RepID=UPI00029F0585|nr:phytanoyl-CoA dioxygenase family protein [[Leptolyngbya] sp. PCC 7376]AFY40089.1 Phytanoyl-CoA dioxygenase [[Leptolyngbya] sp. PCC 7376]